MISSLHYISQGDTPREHLENIERICEAGGDWVQLRLKNESPQTVLETAKTAKLICDRYGVKLIINDYPEITKQVDACGVHLGKKDACPLEARKMLGPKKIIGGTANTLEDCEHLVERKVDYIGLGPFRYTTTKKDLSPVLGIDGYRELLSNLQKNNISTPVIAIGGITSKDLPSLAECGIHGVAVSGFLSAENFSEEKVREIFNHFSVKQL